MADVVVSGSCTDKELEDAIFAYLPSVKFPTKQDEVAFLHIAKALRLNPFKREIYAIPYGGKVNLVTGYDVYLKRADRSGKLNGWKCVVSEDGKSAVCTIHRKDWEFPFEHIVYIEEARKDSQIWRQMPKFMLRKVTIGQAFRLAFPDELGGYPYLAEETTGQRCEDIPEANVVEPDKLLHKKTEDKDRINLIERCTNLCNKRDLDYQNILDGLDIDELSTEYLEELVSNLNNEHFIREHMSEDMKRLVEATEKAAQEHGVDIMKITNNTPLVLFEIKRIENLKNKIEKGSFNEKVPTDPLPDVKEEA